MTSLSQQSRDHATVQQVVSELVGHIRRDIALTRLTMMFLRLEVCDDLIIRHAKIGGKCLDALRHALHTADKHGAVGGDAPFASDILHIADGAIPVGAGL
mmetsp:Transcript_25636/g.77871  ORF Transcript_25636/g.77871 Transcript_25636/m.77871 type:complete len:100 (-) Transcript_25636:343-642(-)